MMKEQEIRLFGRKISLPENAAIFECCGESSEGSRGGSTQWNQGEGNEAKGDRPQVVEDEATKFCELMEQDEEEGSDPVAESQNTNPLSELDDNPKTHSTDGDAVSENEPRDATYKTLKKPDKIIPCPRCNSMDTKFCYYNNYNVNQPRYFCKSCQRYWTAGGTMRNVPVGPGRRKSKNSVSHCQHIMISEALHAARFDTPNGFNRMKCKPNGTVLSFGPDSPLCESMASALNLADKSIPNGFRNGYCKVNQVGKNGDNMEDRSVESSGRMSNSPVDGEKPMPPQPVIQNINGFPSSGPCIPSVPWSLPWNSVVAFPAIWPPRYPLPYYPTTYWSCGLPNARIAPRASMPSPISKPSSPLGKHSRNGELIMPNNSEEPIAAESLIVIPKTLRIYDPEEAAKSSIWTTLGIKYGSFSREGLFKALQSTVDEEKQTATNSPLLQANPAALSRAISFQERA